MCYTHLQGLHEVGLDGVFHQHGQGSAHTLQGENQRYSGFSFFYGSSYSSGGEAEPLTRSSVVTGAPLRLVATTILARRWRMSSRLLVRASTAMISLATVMSNWAWRERHSHTSDRTLLDFSLIRNPPWIVSLYLSGVSLLGGRLADGDLPQEAIVGVQHWIKNTNKHFISFTPWMLNQKV